MSATGCLRTPSPVAPRLSKASRIQAFRYEAHLCYYGFLVPLVFHQLGVVQLPGRATSKMDMQLGALSYQSELAQVDGKRFVRGHVPFLDFGFTPNILGLVTAAATIESATTPGGRAAFDAMLAGLPSTSELVKDMVTKRYELTAEQVAELAATMTQVPVDLDAPRGTLWMSEEFGVPVRIELFKGTENGPQMKVSIELSDINDPDIDVTTPQTTKGSTGAATITQEEDWVDTVLGWADALFQGISGGFSPKTVNDTVEIVEEAAPSIKKNIDNIEEWRTANPDDPTVGRAFREADTEEHNWLYDWFWGLLQ